MIRGLEFPASYGPVQKIKVKGQLVYRTDWKRTNGRTDATDRVIFPLNTVGSKYGSLTGGPV